MRAVPEVHMRSGHMYKACQQQCCTYLQEAGKSCVFGSRDTAMRTISAMYTALLYCICKQLLERAPLGQAERSGLDCTSCLRLTTAHHHTAHTNLHVPPAAMPFARANAPHSPRCKVRFAMSLRSTCLHCNGQVQRAL